METTEIPQTPLPEAAFSLTIKGYLAGREAMLTVRGMTAETFKANCAAVKGILEATRQDPPVERQSSSQAGTEQPEGWCSIHGVQMSKQSNERGSWWSHKDGEGWCRGKRKKGA